MNDVSSPVNESLWNIRPFAELLVAMRFLTRLPLPFLRTFNLPPLVVSLRFFPVAGAIIGALISAVLIVVSLLGLPALLTVAITLAIGTLITGGLHEDGLADVADGFGGGHSREQRLEIMRDSQIGSYGAIALCLVYMARASIYETIAELDPLNILLLLASAAGFSRALVVDLLWATGPARRDGLSVYAGRPGKPIALFSLIVGGVGAIVAVSFVLGVWGALLSISCAALMLGVIRALAIRMIGGQTGDVCGAAQVLCEMTMLSVFTAIIH